VKILVTGHEGQVARSLAEYGRADEIVFAGRPELDLADPGSVERAVFGIAPQLVISAAAYTAVDKAEDEPALAMAVNGQGPGVLARAAAGIGAPIIHLSTDYVFNGDLDRPWREDDPVAPLGVYGATKLAGEQAVASSGARYAIVRTAWVYSPFGSNFVKTMLRLAETRDVVDVVEDQSGCPTSAFDIADAVMRIVDAWREDPARGTNEVYHFAGTGETDWAGFARAIFAASKARNGPSAEVCGIPSSAYPTAARRPVNSRLDSGKFAAVYGCCAPEWHRSLAKVMDRLLPPGMGSTRGLETP
jgi:dTDP-4-dehydrorhamnose reductase